jgi:hypothetical protein
MGYDRLHAALDRALRSKKAWDTRRGVKDKGKDRAVDSDPRAERLHIALDRVLDAVNRPK